VCSDLTLLTVTLFSLISCGLAKPPSCPSCLKLYLGNPVASMHDFCECLVERLNHGKSVKLSNVDFQFTREEFTKRNRRQQFGASAIPRLTTMLQITKNVNLCAVHRRPFRNNDSLKGEALVLHVRIK